MRLRVCCQLPILNLIATLPRVKIKIYNFLKKTSLNECTTYNIYLIKVRNFYLKQI